MHEERIRVFARFVRDLATLSKCTDKGVAAIIINEDATQVLSIGVNGGPKGGKDCLCVLGGKYTCVHAEANALAKCTSDCTNKTMICSLSPCVTCATLIVNSGIRKVYYLDQYKDDAGINILFDAGVTVHHLKDSKEEPIPDYIQTLFDKRTLRIPECDVRMQDEILYYCKRHNKQPRVFNDPSTLSTVFYLE